MNRRNFVASMVGAVLASGIATVFAQKPGRVFRVGFISADRREAIMEPGGRYEAFAGRLRELGFVEGKNLLMDTRFAEQQYGRMPVLASELLKLKPDVILSQGSLATDALKQAATTVPVVFHTGGVVVGNYVESFARPGGTFTGINSNYDEAATKHLEFLKLVVPSLKHIGMLVNPTTSTTRRLREIVEGTAGKLGVSVRHYAAASVEEIELRLAAIAKDRLQALVVPGDQLYFSERRRIAGLALKYRLPAIFAYSPPVEAGGLMSYGTDILGEYRRAADFVGKILNGVKPAEIPVEMPTRLELVVNASTAKVLGITLSQELLLRATRVIE